MNQKEELNEENKDNIDDDEEEDDDYVPPEEDDDNDDEEKGSKNDAMNEGMNDVLSPAKQAAVDDAFTSLFGYTFQPVMNSKKNKKNKNKKKRKKQEQILADIFGGTTVAKKIMSSTNRTIHHEDNKKENHKKRKRFSSMMGTKEVIHKESKIFAGQTIEIEKRSIIANSPDNETSSNKGTRGGIDSVLEQLQKPSKLNTLDKTSSDWDTFKDKNQLKDDLEEKAQGKNAFLIKQDFLTRVDQRQFEKEKAQRDLQRAAAKK